MIAIRIDTRGATPKSQREFHIMRCSKHGEIIMITVVLIRRCIRGITADIYIYMYK